MQPLFFIEQRGDGIDVRAEKFGELAVQQHVPDDGVLVAELLNNLDGKPAGAEAVFNKTRTAIYRGRRSCRREYTRFIREQRRGGAGLRARERLVNNPGTFAIHILMLTKLMMV